MEILYENYKEDVKEFINMYKRYKEGEIFESDFKNFRLKNGIYGQRQPGFQMVRIKIPGGLLSTKQMREIADIGDEFSNGVAHITTRQDIQYHWIKIEDVPQIIERVNKVGLTTKDACGNTVRNIVVSYLAGVCPNEPFDVLSVSRQIGKNFLGLFGDLPRKFKIAFSCCEKHSYLILFNDIGFVPAINNGKAGFYVYLGGGLGDRPKLAYKYSDFVEIDKLSAFIKSVLTVFDKYGDRKNKRRNRMKFLIENLGFEKFLDLVKEELEHQESLFEIKTQIYYNDDNFIESCLPVSEHKDFNIWISTNVIPQKQQDLFTVVIKVNLGNITTVNLRYLADIAEKYSLITKTTQEQNIAFLNVKKSDLYNIYNDLKLKGLNHFGSNTYLDITACPGSETCALGITSSRDLARAIYENLPKDEDSLNRLKNVKIKISGCPNSCAHHHVASIGLHGVAEKIDNTLIPSYFLHIGGIGDLNNAKIGASIIKIPAKNVPDVINLLLNKYLEESNGESFEEFYEKFDRDELKTMLEKFRKFHKEDLEYNKDWGSDKEFLLEDLGVGECAGIIADKVEENLREAERMIKQAYTHISKGFPDDALLHLKKAIDLITTGLLIPFGIKAEGEKAVEKFVENIIGRKLIKEEYIDILTDLEIYKDVKLLYNKVNSFYEDSKRVYLDLRKKTEEKFEKGEVENKRKEILNLKGVECPFNYVQAKLKIREMPVGAILVINIDNQENAVSVANSLKDDGHEIVDFYQDDKEYTIIVRKR
ncbi:MAG: sulfurtransferase TusA family protein [Hydrogenothermaceae bacterium]|nr:sulfurtransferase TusA family protein [Hydrogenothermaceae bacterium]